MIKAIFLHNLSKIFLRNRVYGVTEKKIFDEICQKDGFCNFWSKIRF